MKVIIADSINEKGISDLKEVAEVTVATSITPEELVEVIKEYDAIVVRSRTKVTREVIEAGSKLKVIARAGVGVDNVDVQAATEKGIMVINAPESTSITVAEHSMGLMMSLARKISIADKSVKSGQWEKSKFMGIELNNKTLGIVGMGRIGSQVVIRAKAFNMEILVYDPYISKEAGAEMGVSVVDLETLLKESDVITIHVPLTPETRHLISTREMEIMKNTAFIINCARGGIVDEDALYYALKNDIIGGAALDVFESEPPQESPLLELDNLLATPHIGASTAEAQRDAALIVANEIITVFQGGSPRNVLNMPVMDSKNFKIMKPYLDLSEKMGSFMEQATSGNIKNMDVTYCGELSEMPQQDILTRTMLQGILNPILTEPVNLVNAPSIAQNRGIIVTEGKRCESEGYKCIIKLEIKTDKDEFSLDGTYVDEPKIIKINNYWVDVKPEGTMVIAKYQDLPGTIGAIGTKLGEHEINIATMQVGRKEVGGEAIMVLKVDQSVPQSVIDEVKKMDHVEDAVALEF
ncbi:phosphoglycerate dehydrogenase [Methanobacterium alkalithermotolerans]|uniref:D-3-phosphoglycerate dehydrogenase n=1 Tax=Methanobacterium alkalithermotolerans TaxID=2731220 RepID=A0A8T8K9L3_9EURY|nr:phosphoglycerate dehydrogenase [Methanobacterium alkalithermotolerans]QUH24285.1 phosphoglycerate dehydrogenase [Methanobacterium alkalithermotolerans]